MNNEQRTQHGKLLRECLLNRRTSVAAELSAVRAQVVRAVRDAGRDPVFGTQRVADLNMARAAELEEEFKELDSRIAAGV